MVSPLVWCRTCHMDSKLIATIYSLVPTCLLLETTEHSTVVFAKLHLRINHHCITKMSNNWIARTIYNAATQLHYAAHLKFLGSQHPDWLLEIIYLTVCGYFNDAWQSRSMLHLEHIKLVLQAGYFFDMWATYLDRCGYNRTQHYVSCEFTDVIQFLINGRS
jgi:hypothetical protein